MIFQNKIILGGIFLIKILAKLVPGPTLCQNLLCQISMQELKDPLQQKHTVQ